MPVKGFRRQVYAGILACVSAYALAEPGVSADKIIIGQSAGFTGAAAPRSPI